MNEKRTSQSVLDNLRDLVESKKSIPKEMWLECAFFLNLLGIDDAQALNKMNQAVAQKKLSIYNLQEKRNVAAVELEVESSDEFREMKNQEAKIYAIKELVRIAKKNSDESF